LSFPTGTSCWLWFQLGVHLGDAFLNGKVASAYWLRGHQRYATERSEVGRVTLTTVALW